MYTAAVFYFSGTGNTWWVADRIKRRLDAAGLNASMVSVDTLTPKKADWWIKTADLVLFGWPVSAGSLPEPVRRLVDSLPVSEKGKHIHLFCTKSGVFGGSPWSVRGLFAQKGLVADTAVCFVMPSNKTGSRALDEAGARRMLVRCEKQVERYVTALLTGKAPRQGRFSGWLDAVRRGVRFEKSARLLVGVSEQRCTRCGLCVRLCPMQNIVLKDKIEFLGRCTRCMRCYALCPQSAITFSGRVRNVTKHGKPYAVPDKRFISSL